MSEEDAFAVHAKAGLADAGTRVLKHGDTFLVCDPHGDVIGRTESQLGLFHDGTRHLSHLCLRLGRAGLLQLGSSVTEDNILLVVSLMNSELHEGDELVLDHGKLHVRRERLLIDATLHERIRVTSYADAPKEIALQIQTRADFVDLFEIRGTEREHRGTRSAPELAGRTVIWRYRGLDDRLRTTRVSFDPAPAELRPERATFRLRLEPGAEVRLHFAVQCNAGDDEPPQGFDEALAAAREVLATHHGEDCGIASSNELFDAWVHRSQADLRMMVSETEHGPYPYAGVPWFNAPFGRDGIITALEALWMSPSYAAGVLSYLAAKQATGFDDDADAEPGKIVHEVRGGEMAARKEVPFGLYYGSVDSTPLFVLLAARYHRATGDDALLGRLWPHVLRALEWIDRYGDRDEDGFVEYGRRKSSGLLNQGWKDANDSIFHADGSDIDPPIALCEVQGYVYAAKREIADVADARGDAELARKLRAEADTLRTRFDRAFFCEEIGTYAMALDGHKRPCKIRTSNAGHALFTGIAFPERARAVADQLLSPALFSGWGVRTLAVGEARYNPMSYHNGTVWPHDNALVAEGLARYGLGSHVERVLSGMFGVSTDVDLHRLPELFCGFDRHHGEGPTLYPVACSPQAWAAASVFMLIGASLGLRIDGRAHQIELARPALPAWLDHLQLTNLRVGEHRVDLTLHRYPEDVALTVERRSGPVEVRVVK